MLQIGGSKKMQIKHTKNVSWTKIGGKFINFVEIGRICIIRLGDGHPAEININLHRHQFPVAL